MNDYLDKNKRPKPEPKLNLPKFNYNNPSIASLREQEINPENQSLNNNIKDIEEKVTYKNNFTGKNHQNKKIKSLLKGAPLITLLSTTVIGGIIVSIVISMLSLLPIYLKETLTQKFNYQLASLNIRSNKLLSSKINDTTKGVCSSKINVLCKYSTMSEKQVKNLEKAGVKVNSDSETITGRVKPASFEYDGKTITASEFSKELKNNNNFKSAINKAYSPKLAGFSDSIWQKIAKKFKISKTAVDISGKTDEERLKKVQSEVNDSNSAKKATSEPKVGDKKNDGTDDVYTQKDIDRIKAANKTANEIADGADKVSSSATKVGPEALDSVENAATKGVSEVGNLIKITGLADNACMAYGSVQAVGYAAKAVRSVQLARYAMIFLNIADQIKAGKAKAEDVSYIGKILTTTTKNLRSATDSYGYKYAAYGDTGKMSTSAAQFLTGGGLTGELIGVTDTINKATGGKPKKVCKVLGNPIVGTGSLIVGIAALIAIPEITIGVKDIPQIIASVALNLAAYALPAMLQDIVAGVLVDKNTVGEASGDAITSGASYLMGSVAAAGGNAPLTPQQAVDYSDLSKEVAAQYNEIENQNINQFDIANSNTFLGKIFSQLTPYISNLSSLSGVLNSITSIFTGSVKSLTYQTTNAANSIDSYQSCQDMDYSDLNGDGDKSDRIATDPFCNIVYGIPVESLNKDPNTVARNLINSGQIDESGNIIGKKYKDFMANCINRSKPLGDTGSDGSESDGSECLFNASKDNEDFYLYYIDQRADKAMDGVESSGTSSTADTKIDVANLYNDSTSIACANGTTDAGTADGYTDGNLVKIRLCLLPNTIDSDENLSTSREAAVNSRVSGAWMALINEMRTATGDDTIKVSSSFRTMEMQKADKAHYGDDAAEPGYSNHQMGLAIDFDTIYGSSSWGKGEKPYYDFLSYNGGGAKYGFNQLSSEAWHWEPIH